jgi:hypothetical protein
VVGIFQHFQVEVISATHKGNKYLTTRLWLIFSRESIIKLDWRVYNIFSIQAHKEGFTVLKVVWELEGTIPAQIQCCSTILGLLTALECVSFQVHCSMLFVVEMSLVTHFCSLACLYVSHNFCYYFSPIDLVILSWSHAYFLTCVLMFWFQLSLKDKKTLQETFSWE